MRAFEIAEKVHTTASYVWKVLSKHRDRSKVERGGYGRIFGHGKVFYEAWVSRKSVRLLRVPVVNNRSGMRQVGFKRCGDPCSCQIHVNGRIVIWPHSSGWRDWLLHELTSAGWSEEQAGLVAHHNSLNVKVVEGGVKPGDPVFLPKDLFLETTWGAVLVRDDTPERGVLELKLSIPNMQRYLGVPEIKKRLEALEQGTLSVASRMRTLEGLVYALCRLLQQQAERGDGQ